MNGVRVCCINCGSSSVKLNVYQYNPTDNQLQPLKSSHTKNSLDAVQAFNELGIDINQIHMIVHRYVNGGHQLRQSCIINDKVYNELHDTVKLDKLHNQPALTFISHCTQLIQNTTNCKTKQAVVFDTEYYMNITDEYKLYALPQLDTTYPIIRYSFHGIAHQSMVNQYNSIHVNKNDMKLITLQLGSGCSATAIHNNEPITSSMGFTPLEGLIMSTRCGTIDCNIVLYLQRELHMSIDEIESLLYHKSGLLGITNGYSNDMQKILESSNTNQLCQLAVDMFVNRVIQTIGSYTAILNGCDSICFGGGIGENSSQIRELICHKLQWLGVELDTNINNQHEYKHITCISTTSSKVSVYVVPVDEAILMAKNVIPLINIKNNL